ncbi:riboflavin synthase [Teichococcus vastitatis]|jgi:riboflavin synthase|uniref:Riboflavin synthase n=1 Tax=Teichococcus vastitatis TaxID=2307076 RepID=A0ABS9W0P2_9PROT|nr:riboflavin synthase [Pseudoroseomonas vastitatis]MCI0752871.1 riboflavin synthase [Pseudoroseomonas vastitatis]
MFTGIITATGRIAAIEPIGGGHDMRLAIETPAGWLEGAAIGASIACSGCCLTVVALQTDRFIVEVSGETLSKTTLDSWRENSRINLERALKMGDEMGGHVVSGHVDGVAELLSVTPENGSLRLWFRLPPELAPFVAPKGSISIEGASLTVNEVEGANFGVNIIPHTAGVTTLGDLRPGSRVNIEIDMLARYVARLRQFNLGDTKA